MLFALYLNQLKFLKTAVAPLVLSVLILVVSIIPVYRVYVFDSGAARLQAVAASKSEIIKNYFSHFNPAFLFLQGDKNLRSQQANFGQLFPMEAALLIIGLIYIGRKPKNILPLMLILIAPIPAAITRESPHALRAISMIPFISIISAYGVNQIGKWIKGGYVGFILTAIYMVFFANYFWSFLNIYPDQSKTDWQYDYRKIYTDSGYRFNDYNKIFISDKYAQPYIFALFYLKYDPIKFRQEAVRNSVDQWGFSTVKSFSKFEFGKFDQLVSFR